VGIFRLRILVQILHVGMRGRGVQVEVILFHVFAVIAFIAGKTEEPLFKDGVASVPKRKREAHALVAVADSRQPILVPAISPRPGLLMRKILPGLAVSAVVFANGAPSPLAHVRPPALPVSAAIVRLLQAHFFFGHEGSRSPRAILKKTISRRP